MRRAGRGRGARRYAHVVGELTASLVSLLLLASSVDSYAAGHAAPKATPPKSFPAPPTLPRIRVTVAKDHLLVVHEVFLGRGAWTTGDLDAYVAFGAPGMPRALDARLYPVNPDEEESNDDAPSEPVPIDRASRRPASARLLLGVSTMAGAVLHLRDNAFRWATQPTGYARIRIRTLLDLPAPDVRTGREVLVRLGTQEGEPLALGVIEIASDEPRPWLTRAEAHLCGSDADPWPLAVRFRSEAAAGWRPGVGLLSNAPIAPMLSVRHASDDLCVRFWTTPPR